MAVTKNSPQAKGLRIFILEFSNFAIPAQKFLAKFLQIFEKFCDFLILGKSLLRPFWEGIL